jgi:hypothetical protein
MSWVVPVSATNYSYPPYNSLDPSPANNTCTNGYYLGGLVSQYCVQASTSNGQAYVYASDQAAGYFVYAHAYFDNDQYGTGAPSIYEPSGIFCCVYPSIQMDSLGPVQVVSGTADASIDTVLFLYYSSCFNCTPSVTFYSLVQWDAWTQGNAFFQCTGCNYGLGVQNDAAGYYAAAGGVQVGAGDNAMSGSAVANFEFTQGQCPCWNAHINNLGISG